MAEALVVSAGECEDGSIELRAVHDGGSQCIRFWSTVSRLVPRPEGSVSAFLVWAMRQGLTLRVDGELNERFSDGLRDAQAIYASWYPELKRVPVEITSNDTASSPIDHATRQDEAPAKQGVAAFFTGGVDSFYTLLKKQHEIDTMVYVHGFDVDLEDASLREKVSTMLRSVSGALGKRLIELETDFRGAYRTRLTSRMPNWPLIHGAALATAAHLLQDTSRIYIPATFTYSELHPWGSHPLLDPKWSSSRLEIIHHGCEADRIEKCRFIVQNELALRFLRVCWENPNSAYNCGRCEKCRRTMINLAAVGALNRCESFDSELSAADVARLRIRSEGEAVFLRQNLQHLRATGEQPELAEALNKALRRYHVSYGWLRAPRRLARRILASNGGISFIPHKSTE